MYVRTYVRTYVCMYVSTYVRMYVRTYVRMYVRMYVCMYVRMYVCMYVERGKNIIKQWDCTMTKSGIRSNKSNKGNVRNK